MTKKKKHDSLDTIPQLALKGDDYFHEVPEQFNLSLFVQWKKKDLNRDELSNVKSFQKKEGELIVTNRVNPTIRYRYELKEVKRVFVVIE